MDDDDVGPSELIAAGDPSPDVRAVVDEQLEVEARRQPARVAVAAGGLVDAPETTAKGEIRGLEGVDEQRPVGAPVLDPQESGVTLELRQPERRIESPDDGLEQVAGDRRRVFDLATRQVCRVAGQVGDDEEPGLWCSCHGQHGRPWSRSNVNPRRGSIWISRDPAAARLRGDTRYPRV